MKKIKLTKGFFAIVDDEDFERISSFRWHFDRGYAARFEKANGKQKKIYMHRELFGSAGELFVDHKNRVRHDNRKSNLRLASKKQNTYNANPRKKIKGVYWIEERRNFKVQIQSNKKIHFIGYFKKEKDAAIAYNMAAKKYFGSFAFLNPV